LEEKLCRYFLLATKPEMMALNERTPFFEFTKQYAKWKTDKLTAEQMHAFLKWDKREFKARFVAPRRKLLLGEELPLAIVLHNPLDRPQIVFPFERARFTERGKKDKGTRVCSYSFQESAHLAGHLYVIPPHDDLVIPVSLPPEPAGICRVDLGIQLTSFADTGGIRGSELKTLATQVIEYNICEAESD